jgi:hypothetical protein
MRRRHEEEKKDEQEALTEKLEFRLQKMREIVQQQRAHHSKGALVRLTCSLLLQISIVNRQENILKDNVFLMRIFTKLPDGIESWTV